MWEWSPIRDWLSGVITPYWTFPLLTLVQALMVMVCIILIMAFYTLAERKVIGWIQARRGPNRVNLFWIPGLGQPFADVVKLMFKEILIPTDANGFLFRLAPFLALVPSLAIWAVIPFSPDHAFANIDAGLLYVLALTSMGVYGIMLAGWAANSKYAFLGAMRSAAQIVAYEIAMGFAMVGVLMAAGSLNIGDIIQAQHGGWLSPFDGYLPEDAWLATPSFFWFGLKTLFPMFSFLWLRATFPRYRYDQIMRLGWKALIPVTLVWLTVEGFMVYFHVGPWKGQL